MVGDSASLDSEIRRLIRIAGPMPVAEYMGLCLSHPKFGFYTTHDPLGAGGDFTTAPEISQMFGELVGLWAAAVWRLMGAPPNVNLIELGPGRGTMMSDIIRAAKVLPAFDKAMSIHLVETSALLRSMQQDKLAEGDKSIQWHRDITEVPEGPAIVVANEFYDALPINQAVREADGWHTRTVAVAPNGALIYAAAPKPLRLFERTLPPSLRSAPIGSIFEWRSPQPFMELGRKVAQGGAALVIDYGHRDSAVGDTFQAVRAHRYADPLRTPGQSDLTAHVDFEALGLAASSLGARVHGPVEQAVFLRALGVERRAAALKVQAPPEKHAAIDAALDRLTSQEDTGMGRLFKVIGLAEKKINALPGLDRRSSWVKKT